MSPLRIFVPLVLFVIFIFWILYRLFIKKDLRKHMSLLYAGCAFSAVWCMIYFFLFK